MPTAETNLSQAGVPNLQDLLADITSRSRGSAGRHGPLSPLGAVLPPLSIAGQAGLPLTLASMIDNIAQRGQTDPRVINQIRTGIGHATQSNQDDTLGRLAAAGLQGSGVGQALVGAQGQAGAGQVAQVEALDAQQAEDRFRGDLQSFLDAIVGPAERLYGVSEGVSVQRENARRQEKAAEQAAIAQFIGTLAGL